MGTKKRRLNSQGVPHKDNVDDNDDDDYTWVVLMKTMMMMRITQVSRLRLIDFANVSHPNLGDGAKLHEVDDDDEDDVDQSVLY